MSLLLALTGAAEAVSDAIAQVGGTKDRPKRPRQSDYFAQFYVEPPAPKIRKDDEEIALLIVLGAL